MSFYAKPPSVQPSGNFSDLYASKILTGSNYSIPFNLDGKLTTSSIFTVNPDFSSNVDLIPARGLMELGSGDEIYFQISGKDGQEVGTPLLISGGNGDDISGGEIMIAGGYSIDGDGGDVIIISGNSMNSSQGNIFLRTQGTCEVTDSLSVTNNSLGFFGSTPVTKQALPVTLSDVITLLQNYGLC